MPAQAQPPAPGTVLLADDFADPASGVLPASPPDPSHYERGYVEGGYMVGKLDPEWIESR